MSTCFTLYCIRAGPVLVVYIYTCIGKTLVIKRFKGIERDLNIIVRKNDGGSHIICNSPPPLSLALQLRLTTVEKLSSGQADLDAVTCTWMIDIGRYYL